MRISENILHPHCDTRGLIHSLARCNYLPPESRRSVPHRPHPRVSVASATCSPCRASASVSSYADWDPLAESTSRGMRPVLVSCESLDFFARKIEAMADEGRRQGDRYILTKEEISKFHSDGYVHLKGILSEEEICELEKEFMAFIRREVHVEGRDFCDMSGDYSKPMESFSIINIMLPSKYNPNLKDNLYEKRAASITEQLLGSDMVVDYDQLLAKPPNKPDAEFKWHQDLAYWPITEDTRTASFWLAIDNSRIKNGCVQFVPGSHLETDLRHHRPLHCDRDKSHTLAATLSAADTPKAAEIDRGDATVHHERILHGSGGNFSPDSWRRAWVVAFRSQKTVEGERQIGFTHSHNDNLKVLNEVGKPKSSSMT